MIVLLQPLTLPSVSVFLWGNSYFSIGHKYLSAVLWCSTSVNSLRRSWFCDSCSYVSEVLVIRWSKNDCYSPHTYGVTAGLLEYSCTWFLYYELDHVLLFCISQKFRLASHRKNEERKRRQKKKLEESSPPAETSLKKPLTISLALAAYYDGTVATTNHLFSRLLKHHCLPWSWIIVTCNPLLLCKLTVHQGELQGMRASLNISVLLQQDFQWSISVGSKELTLPLYPILVSFPVKLASVSAVCQLLSTLDASTLCSGNQEPKFLEQWKHLTLTLHG